MKNIYPIVLSLSLFAFAGPLRAQLLLTLKYAAETETWEVYVKPAADIKPSNYTITGSGQVTLVAPHGFTYSKLTNVGGTWMEDAKVVSPTQNPGFDYISFGLIADYPKITYHYDKESLLFSLKKAAGCPDTLYLIDDNDPFDGANGYPWNELSVVDFGIVPTQFYNYTANYEPSAWNCKGFTSGPADPPGGIAADGSFHHATDLIMKVQGSGNTEIAGKEQRHALNPDGELRLLATGHLSVSPNPVKDWFSVHFPGAGSREGDVLFLSGVNGEVWLKNTPGAGHSSLRYSISSLPPGLYLLSLVREGHAEERVRLLKW